MNINHLLNTNPLKPSVVFSQFAVKAGENTVAANQSADKITLSDEAKRLLSEDKSTIEIEGNILGSKDKATSENDSDRTKVQESDSSPKGSSTELTEAELQEVEELKRRDAEVRAHEQAHSSAGGNLTQGGITFDYETGPDGKRYAVGGEVSIDTSAVAGDPQATLRKAQQIRRAATAPVDPSAQDRSVAAEASRMEAQARSEIAQQGRAKQVAYIDENTPEIDFLGQQSDQNEKNVQNTYSKIQNASVLQEQQNFVDFFI
ncbi:MAG: putative metalloprotease CJM1_0395 family protein [Gammaproteobacteria bacterium]|nr:putative metalloprotease CJM1_0395 family protein [Gammaproteobacteria bacterium]